MDINGPKYGHLTLIGRMDKVGGWWLAKCDCGNMAEVRMKYVRAGRVKTCGKCELSRKLMATKGKNRPRGEKAVSLLYNRYVKQEMERGSQHILEYDVYSRKIREKCAFCGGDPLQRKKGPRVPYHNLVTLSRSQVVTENDLVSCCNKCKRWKGDSNYIDFLRHVLQIAAHISKTT